jgi:CHAT domain-containing protein
MRFWLPAVGSFFLTIAAWSQSPLQKVDRALSLEDGYSAQRALWEVPASQSLRNAYQLDVAFSAGLAIDSLRAALIALKGKSTYHQFLALWLNQTDVFAADQLNSLEQLTRRAEPWRGRALNLLGRKLLEQNQVPRAGEVLSATLRELRKDSTANYFQIGRTHNLLGRWARRTGNLAAAIGHYQTAIRIFELAEVPKGLDVSRVLNNLAIVYQDLNQFTQAKRTFERSLALKQKFDRDSISMAISDNNVGNFHLKYSSFLEAEAAYQKGFEWAVGATRADQVLPELCNNYASLLHEQMGEYNRANEFADRAIRGVVQRNGRYSNQLISPLGNKVAILHVLQLFREEKKYLDWLDSIFVQRGTTPVQYANHYIAALRCYSISRDFLRASTAQRKADSVMAHVSAPEVVREYWNAKAEHASRVGQPDSAIAYTRKLLSLPDLPPQEKITSYANLGYYQLLYGAPDSARVSFSRSLQLNQRKEAYGGTGYLFPFYAIRCFYGQLQALLQQPHPSETEVLFVIRAGMAIIRLDRHHLLLDRDKMNYLYRVSGFVDLAIEACVRLHRQRGDERFFQEAFELMQFAKYQILYKSIETSRLQTFANVPKQINDREQRLLREKNQLAQQATARWLLNDSSGALRDFEGSLQKAETSYARLLDSLRTHLPNYYHLKYSVQRISLDSVRQVALPAAEDVLIEYHVMDSTTAILVAAAGGQYLWVEKTPRLSLQIQAFRTTLARPTSDSYESAHALYRLVFARLDSVLAATGKTMKRLMIIPDKDLVYVPFEALARTPGSAGFLINTYTISYALSSALLWQTTTDAPDPRGPASFLGVAPTFAALDADPDMEAERKRFRFAPLANTQRELTEISDLLQKRKVTVDVLTGERATKQAFVARLPGRSIIHIASHGFVNMTEPLQSGIAFSDDPGRPGNEVLFGFEVFNLNMRARLVTLSACETGLGRVYRGEGLMGLSRSFIYAGASNLVLSLWKVADQSTAMLMVDFYRDIRNQPEFSTALRKAKLKMLKDERHQHPYYWAPFILVGS